MSKPSAKKLLTGRTIVDLEMNPFSDGRGGKVHDPVLILDNGARISFTVQEAEVGKHGIGILYRPPLVALKGRS